VYSYQRLLNKKLAAQFSYNAFYFANAEDYLNGKITDFSQVGVREVDPLTLEFRLRAPTPFFPSALNSYSLLPVHRPTIEKFDAFDHQNTAWTKPGNLVSNGPFMLKEWKPNQYVSVVPNPYYWDRAVVRLKEIRFYGVDSEDSEERMFRSGQLDVTYNMPLAKIDFYRAKEPELLRITEYYGTYYFIFNTRKPPLDDSRVRRALAMSIDRKAIIDNVARANQKPALEFAPPGAGGYQPGAQLREDRDEARRLLAEAGYPGGRGFPKLELLFNTSEQHRPISEAIQQMWKRELGIDVTLVNQEWKVYLNAIKTGDYQIARAGWIGTVPDPHEYLQNVRTNAGNNFTGWGNAEYDRILAESERTPDNTARFKLLNELDVIFIREMPAAPLFHYTRPILIRPSVKGFPGNARDQRWYKDMYLAP
jgi:oligopeptide transport system substrate-binding protein